MSVRDQDTAFLSWHRIPTTISPGPSLAGVRLASGHLGHLRETVQVSSSHSRAFAPQPRQRGPRRLLAARGGRARSLLGDRPGVPAGGAAAPARGERA